MDALDPRHGTTRGHAAGCRDSCCREARNADERARRKRRQVLGIERSIDATGTSRRIRALMAIGHSSGTIGARFGVTSQAVLQVAERTWVQRHTAAAIARAYDELRDVEGTSTRTRRAAARNGWATPDRWLNIDDPNETPDPGYQAHRSRRDLYVDPVVVERILGGDFTLAATTTKAEKVEVVAWWRELGRPLNELERETGWEPRKYLMRESA